MRLHCNNPRSGSTSLTEPALNEECRGRTLSCDQKYDSHQICIPSSRWQAGSGALRHLFGWASDLGCAAWPLCQFQRCRQRCRQHHRVLMKGLGPAIFPRALTAKATSVLCSCSCAGVQMLSMLRQPAELHHAYHVTNDSGALHRLRPQSVTALTSLC